MPLGRYEPQGTDIPEPYTEIAEAEKDTYFSLGENWNKIKDKYGFSDDDMFKLFNIPALDDAAKAGKTIRFCHNPELIEGKSLWNEYMYLKTKYGLKIKQIGEYWYAK